MYVYARITLCTHTHKQRQLICLARVLLRRAAVVVMDEATASMDSQTDAVVQRTIREQFKDSTMVIIAHRIATVMMCDYILVMDKGHAVEFGPPHELRRDRDSAFYALASELQEGEH
jgi:ABC-type multidrug transport system fused ATPase/permease subunit